MNDQDSKELIAGQARIEQKVDDMFTRLFGNGQPGVVQNLYLGQKELDRRMVSVEGKQYWMAGVGSALGFVGGILTGWMKH